MSYVTRSSLKKDVDWITIQHLRDNEHKTVKELATMFDVSEGTIYSHCTSSSKKRVPVDAELIVEKYKNGMTAADISKEMECHITTVYRILKKAGVHIPRYKRDKKEKPEPELPKIEEPVKAKPVETVYRHCNEVRQVGFYHGRIGTYIVGLEPGIVELPQLPQKVDEETLRYLIRDLQTVWQEVRQV